MNKRKEKPAFGPDRTVYMVRLDGGRFRMMEAVSWEDARRNVFVRCSIRTATVTEDEHMAAIYSNAARRRLYYRAKKR